MNRHLRRIKPRPISDLRRHRAFRKLTVQVCREEPLCWLRLPGCTLKSTTADHLVPYSKRPDLGMVRGNLRGACRSCNMRRKDTPLWKLAELRAKLIREAQRPRALDFFQGRKTKKVQR